MKKIIIKIQSIDTDKNTSDIIDTYCILSFYYNSLYEKNKSQTIFLDSAIYYDKQVISLFENTGESEAIRNEDIAYNYINLASNLLEKGSEELNTIFSYLEKSEDLMNLHDSTILYNQYWVKGGIAFKQNKYSEAQQIFKDQLSIMDNWLQKKPVSMYADLYQKLSEISERQKDYQAALDYERKHIDYLNQIHDVQKYETIRNLETKYEVSQKELKIAQLTERNRFERTRNYLYLSLAILFLIALTITSLWFKQKKKAADTLLALADSKHIEDILQIQLKEKMLERTELDKYNALLDSHFKGKQISEMDDEMKELKEEQQKLITQIDEYSQKVEEYEKRNLQPEPVTFEPLDPVNAIYMDDIRNLIHNYLENIPQKQLYIDKLDKIDNRFFRKLKENATEELTALNIKHCICFLIDMEVTHMTACFFVEPRSIHMARHRLKRMLNVDKKTEFNLYLKQLSYTP